MLTHHCIEVGTVEAHRLQETDSYYGDATKCRIESSRLHQWGFLVRGTDVKPIAYVVYLY